MLSATNLDFGTYIENQLDGQSTITVTCTNGTAWEVGLNAGSSLGATVNSRSMTGPGLSSLSYNLFTDPARTITWGFRPLLPGQETVSGVGTGAAQVSAVYGRIPANDRSAAPGAFTDTITATVTF
jgi:spore coat protein U-like protein